MITPPTPWTYFSAARVGCTHPRCGTQDTVVLSAELGRRCAEHLPDLGPYDRQRALVLVGDGHPAGAFAWLRTALHVLSTTITGGQR